MSLILECDDVLFLFWCQMFGNVNLGFNILIPSPGVVQPDDAPPFHTEQFTWLGTRFHFHFRFSFQGWNLHLCTQNGIGDTEHQVVIDIVAFPLKILMLLLFDQIGQFSRIPSADPGVTLSAMRDVVSVCHTCVDILLDLLRLLHTAFAMTLRTFVPDDAPFTAAAVTRLDVYKLPEHGSGDLADLSHPAACRAGFEIFIALSSSTVTAAASGMTLHFQGFLHSRSDLLQSEFNP